VAGAAHWPLVPHLCRPAVYSSRSSVHAPIHVELHIQSIHGTVQLHGRLYFICVLLREFFVWPWSFQIYPPTPRMHQPSVSVAKMRTSRPSRTAIHPCICIDARTQHPTPNTTRHDGQFVASTAFFLPSFRCLFLLFSCPLLAHG
jgi:hypothetical protein